MALDISKSVLYKTCNATNIQYSGGYAYPYGLNPIKLSNVSRIAQVKYRAEVAQVVTVGATSYTPDGDTLYQVAVFDPNRTVSGFPEQIKYYGYTTPTDVTDLGATAALQREAISVAIVAAINADASNHAVAATLGTGAGFTITDDGGYYPSRSQTMTNVKGQNTVLITNGYADSNITVTTAAVFQIGVGARLLAAQPTTDWMNGGNCISGDPKAPATFTNPPTYAVSGQNYDAFVIESLVPATSETASGQQVAFVNQVETIWADNGTGSSVTNLAGFKAFERVFHKLIGKVYKNDANTTQEWFDSPIVFQDPLGAAPTGTADTLGWQLSPYGSLNRTNIGTQTIVAPVLDDTGLLLDQDDTAAEGSHTSANQQVLGDQSFIVGQTAFSVTARIVMGDYTDSMFMVGFRKKAVYAADFNNYTDLAAIGGGAADGESITTQGILNNAATVATDSGTNFADGVSMLLQIRVAIDGTVSAYFANANGGWTSAPIYSVGTTTLIFDAGDEMIPFYQHVNIGGGNPALSIGEFLAVATDSVIA